MPCQYVSQNGKACTIKTTLDGLPFCKKCCKVKRAQEMLREMGHSYNSEEAAASSNSSVTVQQDLPRVTLNIQPKVPPPAPNKAVVDPSKVKVKVREQPKPAAANAWVDAIDDDIPDVPPAAEDDSNKDDVLKGLDSIGGLDIDLESDDGSDAGDSEAGEPVVKRRRANKQQNIEFASYILKVGYLGVVSIAENAAAPRLQGLSHNCGNDQQIDQVLEELAEESAEWLGMEDLDPWSKLCILTGMQAVVVYTANRAGQQPPPPPPMVGAPAYQE